MKNGQRVVRDLHEALRIAQNGYVIFIESGTFNDNQWLSGKKDNQRLTKERTISKSIILVSSLFKY